MNRRALICSASMVLAIGVVTAASARPPYIMALKAKYAAGKPTLTAANCGLCHIGAPPQKNFNPWGAAFLKGLGGKASNDAAVINTALEAAAKEKNPATNETFGARLAADALPAGTAAIGGGGGGVSGTWEALYNGVNMDGWTKMNAGTWSVQNYLLKYAANSGNGWLRSNKQYTNYSMTVTWRYSQPGTGQSNNAGIYLKAGMAGNPWPNSPEINMGPGQNFGSISGTTGSRARFDLIKPNDWNTYSVTVENGSATLAINGEVAWESASGIPAGPGYIGIQNEGPGLEIAQVWVMALP